MSAGDDSKPLLCACPSGTSLQNYITTSTRYSQPSYTHPEARPLSHRQPFSKIQAFTYKTEPFVYLRRKRRAGI